MTDYLEQEYDPTPRVSDGEDYEDLIQTPLKKVKMLSNKVIAQDILKQMKEDRRRGDKALWEYINVRNKFMPLHVRITKNQEIFDEAKKLLGGDN